MKYELIAGLEIHLQTKTKSKMFCSCSADYFADEPNTHTCPVCLGLPGAMPVPNKRAIEQCIMLGSALGCHINTSSKFDRKNYFYPDLPKGFQISQYDKPFCERGSIEVMVGDETKTIRITRVHQEEDTGKSIHENGSTYLDFNKSGVPLSELVTEPDFRSGEEIEAFAKQLRLLVRYLGISDADMQKGQMRFELNMSLRPVGTEAMPDYKVEVKNIGSISVLKKIVETEFKRQSELLDKGITPDQETRGFTDLKGTTVSMRKKETAADYRYFPEPDIPEIHIDEAYLTEIQAAIPELPSAMIQRLSNEYGIQREPAERLVWQEAGATFEKALQNVTIPSNSHVTNDQIAYAILNKEISEDGDLIQEITHFIESKQVVDVSEDDLSSLIAEVCTAFPKQVEDYKAGKEPLFNFLFGHIMKKRKGLDAGKVRSMLQEYLK